MTRRTDHAVYLSARAKRRLERLSRSLAVPQGRIIAALAESLEQRLEEDLGATIDWQDLSPLPSGTRPLTDRQAEVLSDLATGAVRHLMAHSERRPS
mgnify:CR=1 FL=1